MVWHLKTKPEISISKIPVAFSRIFIVSSAIFITSTTASYGSLEQTTIKKLAQAPNPQGDPNRERFPQPLPTPAPLPPETQPPITPTPTPQPAPAPDTSSLQVNKIQVIGSTIFTATELDPITKPLTGRTVTLEELRKVADAITQLYLNRGYITSRAILTDQTVKDGVVQIQVIEGSIERIDIEGTQRVNPNYVRSRVQLGAGKPLSAAALEDQLRLLRLNPLFSNIEASLRPGTQLGKSIVLVRVTEANPLEVSLSVDNYSPPSVGSERLGISGVYRNLTGNGDEIAASYYLTTRGGANIYDFSYRLPLNPKEGTLQLRTAFNNNNIVQEPFKQFEISGESQLYEISYRQPLIRTTREEFALSLAFAIQNGQTFTFAGPTPFGFGPDAEGNSRTRVIKFGQDYIRRDVSGAWAVRSVFNFGIDIFDPTINPDPIPDGRFFSWLAQLQRVQRFSDDNFLIAQADLQLTPNGLLPSQQFVIGGGQSVRGYRQNMRAGDNGLRFSLENRWTVQRDANGNSILQIAPFVDFGWVWNVDDNPNRLQRQNFLAGVGLGLLWEMAPRLNVRVDYGLPLVNLDDRGDNAQDNGLYFSVAYRL